MKHVAVRSVALKMALLVLLSVSPAVHGHSENWGDGRVELSQCASMLVGTLFGIGAGYLAGGGEPFMIGLGFFGGYGGFLTSPRAPKAIPESELRPADGAYSTPVSEQE